MALRLAVSETRRAETMKILYVHECCGALAGAEANVLITGAALRQRGHEVALLYARDTGQGIERWREVFSSRFALGSNGGSGAAAAEACRRFEPDVIYVHKMSELDALRALLRAGRPAVRMVHDHDIYCMRSYKYFYFSRKICRRPASWRCVFPCGAFVARNRPGRFGLRWVSYWKKKQEIRLARRFDRMLVVTEYMRQELIRNGFDPAKIDIRAPCPKPADGTLSSNFDGRNLIVYAGQIIRGKGVDVLLEALRRVRVPFECAIFGDGAWRKKCQRRSRRLGLEARVRFKGFVPQEELKSHYRECSVVAIPSVWPEPIATIGLEVMRYGLPVVAFDAGGIRDWLRDGENGFLVPWMDCDSYARRLEQILSDKHLARRMGECGRELVNRRYGFDEYIASLETLFADLAARERLLG